MRKRTSPIWKIPIDTLKAAVAQGTTLKAILQSVELSYISGGNYRTLKKRLREECIDFSHITLGLAHNKGKRFSLKKIPLAEIMIEHSTYCRSHLKRRLIKEGIFQHRCSLCGLVGVWNALPIVMVLDHINGVNNDHRIGNLRMLCPNCNSQQKTFAGRNRRPYFCKKCGKKLPKKRSSKLCDECLHQGYRKVKDRPTLCQLLTDVHSVGYLATGRKYGVSDNAIRKWIKKYKRESYNG